MVPNIPLTSGAPYFGFLAAYPFPAFVLQGSQQGDLQSLQPIYGNTPYTRLAYGPAETATNSTSNVPHEVPLETLLDADEIHRLSEWFQGRTSRDATAADQTLVVTVQPKWLLADHTTIKLELVKTFMDGLWVCVSVPRTALLSSVTHAKVQGKPLRSPPRKKSPSLKLSDFPPPSPFVSKGKLTRSDNLLLNDKGQSRSPGIFMPSLVSSPTPYATTTPITTAMGPAFAATPGSNPLIQSAALDSIVSISINPAPPALISSKPNRIGEMEQMVESSPWENTELGAKDSWNAVFKTALSICLLSPTSCALWWGPSLVLIYNDKYAEMAGSKHPRIFGKPGSEAWGELWDQVGPLTEPVLRGESVARWDDLLFFDRLTPEDLPEESYHSWSWIPVKGEDGRVEGMINWSIETTEKVIAERRLLTLRAMGERAKLAKNVLQLTSALLTALEKNPQDVPFAAFYYGQTPQVPSRQESGGSGSGTSYIRSSADQNPVKLSLTLVGSVGVPDFHSATPTSQNLTLDPVTYRPFTSNESDASGSSLHAPGRPIRHTHFPTYTTSARSASPGTDSNILTTLSSTSVVSIPSTNGRGSSAASEYSSTVSPSPRSTKDFPSPSSVPWTWPISEAVASGRPVFVPFIPKDVAETLSRRAWGDVPRQAVVVPIRAFESDGEAAVLPRAVLIMGLNPRKEYDDDYQGWIDVLGTSLGVSLATVLSWEAETQRAEQLAQLDAAKTSFFSNASHELRTPLTLIMGPIQEAAAETTNSKIGEKLKLAIRNVSRLSRLVDSLMDFTRIEAGKPFGQFKPVRLCEFTSDLASLFRSTIEKSNIEFRVECDTNVSDVCYVDPDFWEKIVFNLIGNAYKYTMEGSITVRVVYGTNEVVFSVEDTGVGIPQEDIEKVFQRFHRVSTICRSHEGTGIGLSLTKELVRLHGGSLSVSSRTESESIDGSHGSTFTVILPLGKDHLPLGHVDTSISEFHRQQHYARGIVEEARYWSQRDDLVRTPSDSGDSGSGGSSSEGSRMDSSTLFFLKKDIILLVDDNSDMRQYIKSIFSRFCCVIEAVNGQDALNIIDSGVRPNLILSDVMMPVMDGYGLMAALRERRDTKLLPIILVTAKAGEESRIGGLLSGADDYIAKPFQARELVARVHLQMQLGKRRSELEERFEERQREIKILSDNAPIGIVRTDPHGRIIYSNPRWFELTGRSGLSIDDWIESIHPDYTEAVLSLWREVFEGSTSGSLEFRWANGVWTNGQLVPLGNEKSGRTGALFTITDISDQRLYEAAQLSHAQEKEATSRRRAEEAETRRKEADERRRGQELLIDVTSHELRQPVSAILNCSSLVRENLGKLHDELRECFNQRAAFFPERNLLSVMEEDLEALDSIYQCGLAQERIANDVLSLSRLQLEVLSVHPADFYLVPEIRQIVSFFHNELKMKGIKMSLHFGDSLQILRIHRVRSDKSRLAQVLTNLLSNAIKFADTSIDEREIRVTVDVSFKPPGRGTCIPPTDYEIPEDTAVPVYLYLSVKDSGPGLKPEDLNLLFKRFQQGTNSHEVFGGSGLGLFVCRKICELLNGGIEVDSVYGRGATFRFFIEVINSPMGPHPPEITDESCTCGDVTTKIQPKKEVESSGVFVSGHSPNNRPHVLITEDNLINQTVLNRQLKGAGFRTTLASHGQQAIDKVLALASNNTEEKNLSQFDAILMDCEMPVMDGLTAVREIRRLEASGQLLGHNRIYALTGNARSGQIESAREAGMDDVLIKPYKIDELLAKLREA